VVYNRTVYNMELGVDEEELYAVHKWNSAQLVKRRNRLLKRKAFSEWRGKSNVAQKARREEQILPQREASGEGDDLQPSVTLNRHNEDLRRELQSLQREQRELERATVQIREELRRLQGSTPPRTSVFSTMT
jgi:predicted  nucleic acid-binding Zn-ribbon protein